MKEKIPELSNGAFAENIITRGLPNTEIKVGEQVRIGKDIILEITQIGKECHTGCAIRTLTGDCIMPREGLFAKVISGGEMKIGDGIELVSNLEPTEI
jgi:MOSC domain-containing protein YiiM